MKVAVLSAIPVFPEGEGHRSRILALTRAVRALGYDLHFILVPSPFPGECDLPAHRDEFGPDRFTALERHEAAASRRTARNFLQTIPFRLRRKFSHKLNLSSKHYSELDELYKEGNLAELARLNTAHSFDIVIVEYVFYSHLLAAFPPQVTKIIDTHDSFADRHKPYLKRGMTEGYWISLAPKDELRGLRRADAVLAIQHEEAAKFSTKLAGQRSRPTIHVVSHVLDISDPVQEYSSKNAIFLGSSNPSNVFSVTSFIENIAPIILERLPDFKLLLAGSICGSIEDHPVVEKLGMVASLREAFTQAPVSINPTLMGTGINIKLLDAMAAGVPTVSTETGARGLPEDYRDAVIVVNDDDNEGFAAAVISLISSETLRTEMGQRAYLSAARWNETQNGALSQALAGTPEVRGPS